MLLPFQTPKLPSLCEYDATPGVVDSSLDSLFDSSDNDSESALEDQENE